MRYITSLIGLLGLGLLAGCAQTTPQTVVAPAPAAIVSTAANVSAAVAQPTVPASGATTASAQSAKINGVDLSKWQGEVDFAQIKQAGNAYVFIKATQGATGADPNYARNIGAARATGLAAGSYHFYMTNDTAEVQFAQFAKTASVQHGDLPPVVDIEVLSSNSLPDLAAEVVRFLNLLEKQYGAKPIIYSGRNFANDYLKGLADYPLWLAEYNNDQAPQLPLDWTAWTFWQYSQSGSVAGVSGQVDLDRFNGDHARFQALLIRPAAPANAP